MIIIKKKIRMSMEEQFDYEKRGFIDVINTLKRVASTLNSKDEYYRHIIELDDKGIKYKFTGVIAYNQ